MTQITIKKFMEKSITPLLKVGGFKRRETLLYTIDLGHEFLGCVGIPATMEGGTVAVSPVIGVRHQKTHQILSDILEKAYHQYLPPTVSTGLGFLLPDAKWREWYFDPSDRFSSYKDFADNIIEYSSKFFKKTANINEMCELLETLNYTYFKVEAYERLPILKYLAGDVEGAMAVVDQYISETNEMSDPRNVIYRSKYLSNFKKMINR